LYDAASDTLYVFFFAGNRIYKLTANSTDDPATINMPLTADTGGIIKSLENMDGGRLAQGSGQRDPRPDDDIAYVNRQPVKVSFNDPDINYLGEGSGQYETHPAGALPAVSIAFITRGTFGVVVGPPADGLSGYAVYRLDGGLPTLLTPTTYDAASNTYFTAAPPRVYGRGYFAQALLPNGAPSGIFSSVIYDHFNEGIFVEGVGRWDFGRDGDLSDSGAFGEGAPQRQPREEDFTYVNRVPVKVSAQDPDVNLLGHGAGGPGNGHADGVGTWTQAGTTRII
jgi:hypothetical protein